MQIGGFDERSGGWLRLLLPVVIIGVALAVAYGNSFHGPFVFDDAQNIVDNDALRLDSLRLSGLLAAATSGPTAHRWLPNISFALNYYFDGNGDVWGFHLVNFAIHLAATLVFFWLALTTLTLPVFHNRYPRAREVALAATLVWALHPLQTNAVTYLVQRMTSISALFFLASLLFYVRGRLRMKSGQRSFALFVLSLFCAALAVISKENAVMLPVMIVGYEFFLLSEPDRQRDWRKAVAAIGLALLVVLLLAWAYLGRDLVGGILAGYGVRDFTLGERLLTESRVFFLYLGLLALPLPSRLNFCHDISLSHHLLAPPQTALALLALAGLLVLATYLFRRDRLASFAIFWFIGNLLIESTVIPLELIFEHRLYLPSTFVVLAVIAGAYRLSARRLPLLRVLVAVLIVFCVVATWQRNKVWASEKSLWEDVVAKSPELVRGYINLSHVFVVAGENARAERILVQGLAVDGQRNSETVRVGSDAARQRAKLHAALATIYWKSGRWQGALVHAEQALRADPDNTMALITKGIYYEKMGRSRKAVSMYVAASVRGEKSVDLFNNWGMSYFSLGRIDEAINLFHRALVLDANHAESHYNLGIAYGSKGLLAEAQREMALAMQLQQQQR